MPSESQEKNAQRFTENLFDGSELSLPVPIERLDHSVTGGKQTTISTFHVKPQSWVKYLMTQEPEVLIGMTGDFKTNNEAFWTAYRLQHATHAVFAKHDGRLEDVLPIFIHGDEGRGKKKTGYLVFSFESPFGSTERKVKKCNCAAYLSSRPDLPAYGVCNTTLIPAHLLAACRNMFTNYRGHSFLTRHLLFGLGKTTYKSNPHIVAKLLEEMADGFRELFEEGVVIGHRKIFVAVVAVKGDADFHTIYFALERCYSKVVANRSMGYICHLCNAAAGTLNPSLDCSPFEDFSDEPQWQRGMYRSRPWSSQPILASIPYDQQGAQERMIVPDPFHVVKIGLGRDLAGSIIVLLCRKGFFDHEGSSKNLPARLERAHSNFLMYCMASNERPALRGFTKQFFHLKNQLSSPYTNSKGSDTMSLCRWLRWLVSLNLLPGIAAVEGYDGILRIMLQCLDSILAMFRLIHSHRLFLERSCATRLYILIMRFLRGYKLLGVKSIGLSVRAFALKPKTHALHHTAKSLKSQLESGLAIILNPECHGCEPNEDYIGRVSRLSRKVGTPVVDLRVIQRVFLKTRALHRRRKSKCI